MANISNVTINGVSYSFDKESVSPLSFSNIKKATEAKLVYGTNNSGMTEPDVVDSTVDTTTVDKVESPAEKSKKNKKKPAVEIRTATLYCCHSCGSLGITIKYKGSLDKANLDNFYGTIKYGYEGCGGYTCDTSMYSFYLDDYEPTYEDDFFEFVDYEEPGNFTMYGDEAYVSDFGYRA